MLSRYIASPDSPAVKGASCSSKRIVWLDYVRAFAILTVILCHSTEVIYSLEVSDVAARGLFSRIAEFSFFSIGRLGVPLFLFMSGYLMLDRIYDREACIRFWKTKWCGLMLATEIWIVVSYIFNSVVYDVQLDIWSLARGMLFLEAAPMAQMWYMPMILGLYLFLPFIANGCRMLNDARLLAFPLGLMIVMCFVTPVTGIFAMAQGETVYSCIVAPGFSGGTYGCYMLLGYCAKKGAFSRVPTILLVGIFATSFASVVAVQLYGYAHGTRAAVWYDSGLLLLTGLGLFLAFSRTRSLRETRAVSVLSYYSFALYLVHYPVLVVLKHFIGRLGISSLAIQVCMLAVLVTLVSLVVCTLIARIPKVGGKILYMR